MVSSPQHCAKNILEMFVIGYTNMWSNFILIVHRIQENKQKCNFHYAAMSMMTSQILQFMDFTETQKSKYLQKETLSYLQIN